ncbi:MAG: lactate utilization protein [Bacteroidales bacterium]|nr:lactate utilization protein [Bacteroidales bacterium]
MNPFSDKERMLKSVRDALIEKAPSSFHDLDLDTSVYHDSKNSLDIEFAENFVSNGGKFIYCNDVQEAIDNIRFFSEQEKWDKIYCAEETLQRILTHAGLPFTNNTNELIAKKVGMTSCDFLIALTGSIVFSSQSTSGRRILSILDTQIVIGTIEQIQPDLKSAFKLIKERFPIKMPSAFSIVNGLSRVEDIDGEVEQGFGTKQLFLFLIDTTTPQ